MVGELHYSAFREDKNGNEEKNNGMPQMLEDVYISDNIGIPLPLMYEMEFTDVLIAHGYYVGKSKAKEYFEDKSKQKSNKR